MFNVSPVVLAVIALTVVLMVAITVVQVRIIWAFVKLGLFLGTGAAVVLLAVWAWRTVNPA